MYMCNLNLKLEMVLELVGMVEMVNRDTLLSFIYKFPYNFSYLLLILIYLYCRLVLGSGGNLPIYTTSDALGQALLYRLNGRDLTEIYVAHEQLRTGPEENLQLLLSCDR